MSNKEGEAMGGETVKVRVAVAVDADGGWCARGYGDKSGDYPAKSMSRARDGVMQEAQAAYWLTAELPIPRPPAPQEVAAGVEVDEAINAANAAAEVEAQSSKRLGEAIEHLAALLEAP